MRIIIIFVYKQIKEKLHCEKWRTYTARRLFLDKFVQKGEMDYIRPPNCFLQPNTEGAHYLRLTFKFTLLPLSQGHCQK